MRPDFVLAYGDLRQSVLGAQAAVRRGIPVVHVEAGLRSWSDVDDEEDNRKALDDLCSLWVTHSADAADRLSIGSTRPGILSAPPAVTTLYRSLGSERERPGLASRISHKPILVVSIHRRWHLTSPSYLRRAISALETLSDEYSVVLISYASTTRAIEDLGLRIGERIEVRPTLDYESYVDLMFSSSVVVTDSSGIQDESFALGKPTLLLRRESHRHGIGAIPKEDLHLLDPEDLTTGVVERLLRESLPSKVPEHWTRDAGLDILGLLLEYRAGERVGC